MKVALRRVLILFSVVLTLFQGLVPTFATADITIRCAGQLATAARCGHSVYSQAQGRTDDLMSMMPCCKAMARAAVAQSGSISSSQTISDRHCTVKVVWSTTGRQALAISHN